MEQVAITVTMVSSLVLVLAMLAWLFWMVSLLFWLNKYDQEGGLIGGNVWRKIYRKSQAFVETIEDEKEKKSKLNRLKLVLVFQKVILGSLGGVAVAIVLWQFV